MFLYLQVHEGNTIALLGRSGKVNSRTSSTAKAVAHINIGFKMREWPLKRRHLWTKFLPVQESADAEFQLLDEENAGEVQLSALTILIKSPAI